MRVEHLEFLVEEQSMEVCLRSLLPRIINKSISYQIYPSQGKTDLLQKLPDRLKGYAHWLPDNYRIIIVLDKDGDDCYDLKNSLEEISRNAGLISRTETRTRNWQLVNRIAIEELEAWFFGDLQALLTAYPRVSEDIGRQARYRDPDNIAGGTWEALERVLQRAGYMKNGLRKIEAAQAIGQHLDPNNNKSHSFCIFRDVIWEVLEYR